MPVDAAVPAPVPRRRQERGRRRMVEILQAAARVFAEVGYERATTNAIAKEAGISPGSLYQFFADKSDIARALAEHYAEQLDALRADTFGQDALATMSLADSVSRVVEVIVEFNAEHAGFKALFARSDMPEDLRAAIAPLHEGIEQRIRQLLAARNPTQSAAQVTLSAGVAVQLVRGLLPSVLAAEGRQRATLKREMTAAVERYLAPEFGDPFGR